MSDDDLGDEKNHPHIMISDDEGQRHGTTDSRDETPTIKKGTNSVVQANSFRAMLAVVVRLKTDARELTTLAPAPCHAACGLITVHSCPQYRKGLSEDGRRQSVSNKFNKHTAVSRMASTRVTAKKEQFIIMTHVHHVTRGKEVANLCKIASHILKASCKW